LLSAKDDLQQHLQPWGTGLLQVINKLLAVPKPLLAGCKNASKEFSLKLITINASYTTWWTRFSSRRLLKTSLGRLIEQALSLQRCSLPAVEIRKTNTSHNELKMYLYGFILCYMSWLHVLNQIQEKKIIR
jgi:hypothetical protein